MDAASKRDVYVPINITPILYLPGRRVAQFKTLLKNVPGALSSVAKLLYKHGVNVLSGCLLNAPIGESGYFLFFADFTGATASPEEVAKELRRSRKIVGVEYVEGKDLLIDAYCFKLITPAGRIFPQNCNSFAEAVKALREAFGSAADYVLFMQGVKYGEVAVKNYFQAIPLLSEKKTNDVARILAEAARGYGFAVVEVKEVNLDEGRAYLVAYSLFECEPFKGQFNSTNSQYFRGMLTGIARALTGRQDYVVVEEECIAKGDPYCSFRLKGVEQPIRI